MECNRVTVSFETSGKSVEVLRDLSLSAHPGEFLSVLGPSGCGKTTLLRSLAGLVQPDSGTVSGPKNGRAVMVRQECSVFPWLNVLDNAAFGLEIQGVPRPERERRAQTMLARFGLAGRELDYPTRLSAGMKQRVAIVQALVTEPEVLLLDEPLAALDCQTRWEVQTELLDHWERQSHRTVILVTHDVDEALLMSDRIVILTRQPGSVLAEIDVPLPRPRDLASLMSPEALELKRRIMRYLGFAVEELPYAFRAGA
ncbi:MAG: ABC transporter ATP-binding protein [Bryobacteraceae bacterium]